MRNLLLTVSLLIGFSAHAANYPVGGCHQMAENAAVEAAQEQYDLKRSEIRVHGVEYSRTIRMNPPANVYEVTLTVGQSTGAQYEVWTRYNRGCRLVKVEQTYEE